MVDGFCFCKLRSASAAVPPAADAVRGSSVGDYRWWCMRMAVMSLFALSVVVVGATGQTGPLPLPPLVPVSSTYASVDPAASAAWMVKYLGASLITPNITADADAGDDCGEVAWVRMPESLYEFHFVSNPSKVTEDESRNPPPLELPPQTISAAAAARAWWNTPARTKHMSPLGSMSMTHTAPSHPKPMGPMEPMRMKYTGQKPQPASAAAAARTAAVAGAAAAAPT